MQRRSLDRRLRPGAASRTGQRVRHPRECRRSSRDAARSGFQQKVLESVMRDKIEDSPDGKPRHDFRSVPLNLARSECKQAHPAVPDELDSDQGSVFTSPHSAKVAVVHQDDGRLSEIRGENELLQVSSRSRVHTKALLEGCRSQHIHPLSKRRLLPAPSVSPRHETGSTGAPGDRARRTEVGAGDPGNHLSGHRGIWLGRRNPWRIGARSSPIRVEHADGNLLRTFPFGARGFCDPAPHSGPSRSNQSRC